MYRYIYIVISLLYVYAKCHMLFYMYVYAKCHMLFYMLYMLNVTCCSTFTDMVQGPSGETGESGPKGARVSEITL